MPDQDQIRKSLHAIFRAAIADDDVRCVAAPLPCCETLRELPYLSPAESAEVRSIAPSALAAFSPMAFAMFGFFLILSFATEMKP